MKLLSFVPGSRAEESGCDFYICFFGLNCWLKISIVTQPEQKKSIRRYVVTRKCMKSYLQGMIKGQKSVNAWLFLY